MAFCTHCGAQLENGAAFCTQCGSQQGTERDFNPYAVGSNYDGSNYSNYNPEAPTIPGFGEAISICLRKYVVFKGRASRSEYWYWTLFTFLVSFAFRGTEVAIYPPGSYSPDLIPAGASILSSIAGVFGLLTFLPTVSVFVRRMHDTGHSGWLWWLPFLLGLGVGGYFAAFAEDSDKATLAIVGGVFGILLLAVGLYLLILLIRPGDPGDNQYGPAPTRR